MQRPSMNGATLAIAMFQSSSGQKAGCNPPRPRLTRPRSPGFNPHPAFWPDATSLAVKMMRPVASFQSSSGQKAGCDTVAWVSARGQGVFQSSSGQKAGCNRRRAGPEPRQPELVSILIRPSGRMQPRGVSAWQPPLSLCFNPHPARRPDATVHPGGVRCQRFVSILIRPSGRMQPLPSWATPCVIWMFQSSSGLLAGCNLPYFFPSDYSLLVSILIRPEGRMQQVTSPTCRRLSWFQSSSGQKAGCNSELS